jgi:DNA polymerase-3 subunit delta
LSNKRFTVVKEFYPDAKILKGVIKEFLTSPPSDAVLIIINEKPSEALKKFDSVYVVDCKKADALTIAKWIKGECKKEGVEIDGETATTIAKYSLFDMKRVELEVSKLISYKGCTGKITLSDVEENVYKDSEYKIFNLTERIGKKQFDEALSIINEMIGKNEPEQRILISIANHFRRLLFIAISGKTDKELASLFKVNEYGVTKSREQLKYFKTRALKNVVDYLHDADYKIKSGKMEASVLVWLSAFKIMTE